MRQVKLKCFFKIFTDVSYTAMEMPKTAFGQTIDNKKERNVTPSTRLPWMEKLFLFICKGLLNNKSNCRSYWMSFPRKL